MIDWSYARAYWISKAPVLYPGRAALIQRLLRPDRFFLNVGIALTLKNRSGRIGIGRAKRPDRTWERAAASRSELFMSAAANITPVPANIVAIKFQFVSAVTGSIVDFHIPIIIRNSPTKPFRNGRPIDAIVVITKMVAYSGITLDMPPNSEIIRV